MAKYCVFTSAPRYNDHDAVVGTRHRREACFKQLRTAQKAKAKLTRQYGGDEVYVTLCRGVVYCGNYRSTKHAIPPFPRHIKRKIKRSTRATRRERLQPDYIPF